MSRFWYLGVNCLGFLKLIVQVFLCVCVGGEGWGYMDQEVGFEGWGPEEWAARRVGAPTQKKWGCPKGGGTEGWGPEGWGPNQEKVGGEGWGPQRWWAQNFALFSLSGRNFRSFLGVCSWNFGVFEGRDPQMFTCSLVVV